MSSEVFAICHVPARRFRMPKMGVVCGRPEEKEGERDGGGWHLTGGGQRTLWAQGLLEASAGPCPLASQGSLCHRSSGI